MRKIAAALLGLIGLATIPLFAQTNSSDTLSALLTEVRLLRQALERNATAPQLQLLGTRLSVQNTRLQAAVRDHEAAQRELQNAIDEIVDATEKLQTGDAEASRMPGSPEARAWAQIQVQFKGRLAETTAREPRLRAREAELAAAVAEEQNQWLLINRRLDELERTLPR